MTDSEVMVETSVTIVGVIIPFPPVDRIVDVPVDTVTTALPATVEAVGVRVGLLGRP